MMNVLAVLDAKLKEMESDQRSLERGADTVRSVNVELDSQRRAVERERDELGARLTAVQANSVAGNQLRREVEKLISDLKLDAIPSRTTRGNLIVLISRAVVHLRAGVQRHEEAQRASSAKYERHLRERSRTVSVVPARCNTPLDGGGHCTHPVGHQGSHGVPFEPGFTSYLGDRSA